MTVLLIAGCAAATAIGFVGQYGEDHVGWIPICDNVKKFCRTNLASLLLSYLAFLVNLGLTALIAYKCTIWMFLLWISHFHMYLIKHAPFSNSLYLVMSFCMKFLICNKIYFSKKKISLVYGFNCNQNTSTTHN